jgi:hypothetical protein
VADWGNAHLCTEFGPVGKQALRKYFQQDEASWNRLRRAYLRNAQALPVARALAPVAARVLAPVPMALDAAPLCSICMEPLGSAVIDLECGHSFHGVCAAHWFRRSPACPLCRALPRR